MLSLNLWLCLKQRRLPKVEDHPCFFFLWPMVPCKVFGRMNDVAFRKLHPRTSGQLPLTLPPALQTTGSAVLGPVCLWEAVDLNVFPRPVSLLHPLPGLMGPSTKKSTWLCLLTPLQKWLLKLCHNPVPVSRGLCYLCPWPFHFTPGPEDLSIWVPNKPFPGWR